MNKCNRCWENNPAEVHTCTPWYHFSEHEKLKVICDTIWYNQFTYTEWYWYVRIVWPFSTFDEPLPSNNIFEIDIREIIFTQEFMNRFWEYYKLNKFSSESIYKVMQLELFNNLNNPVSYLYNLLWLWTQQ